MPDDPRILFESELTRRGLSFRRDQDSPRYILKSRGIELFISLDNVVRAYQRDVDHSAIARFVDSVLANGAAHPSWAQAQSSILLSLEPADHVEPSELRRPVSQLVDRVPVLFDEPAGKITWISEAMLENWKITRADMEAAAATNLAALLAQTPVEHKEIDGVRLGLLASPLPFKAALMLAPNLRQVVEPVLGWPLYAVAPARDFIYLWAAEHADFAGRVGRVVVDEFNKSPYPISTEVFEISDGGIKAIGAFAADP